MQSYMFVHDDEIACRVLAGKRLTSGEAAMLLTAWSFQKAMQW